MRVAVGAVEANALLAELDMEIANHVVVLKGTMSRKSDLVAEIKESSTQSEVSIVNQEREQESRIALTKRDL